MMDDLISRQAAIDALDEYFGRIAKLKRRGLNKGEKAISLDVVGAIKTLPPIQPKRGRWIKLDMHRGMADHKCTACEQECYVPTCMGEPMYAFCPNCGAKMEAE